jgi:hypothetical protein
MVHNFKDWKMFIEHLTLSSSSVSKIIPKAEVEKILEDHVQEEIISEGDKASPPSCQYNTQKGWLKATFWIYGKTKSETKSEVYLGWQAYRLFWRDGRNKQVITDLGEEALFYLDEFDTTHLLVLKGNVFFSVVEKIKNNDIKTLLKSVAIVILRELDNGVE